MRAWLLLLTVLATFQTIVQVASTEDNNISSAFIRAIQPIKTDLNKTTTPITTTALIQKPPPVITTEQEDFPNGKSENTTEEKEFYKIVYKTYKNNHLKNTKNNSDKNTSEKVQNIQTRRANKFDKKNNKQIEQNKNNLENEVSEKQPTSLNNKKQNKKFNKTNKNNKMALKENQIEQQTENQKITQQIEMHTEEDTNLNKEKSSSTNNHQHHKRHQQQHNHQHQHNQYKSQPASQHNISDNLTTTTSSSSSASSSKTSNGSSSTISQEVEVKAKKQEQEEEKDDAFMSSSTFMENDDGAISVESQQPQLDAVIPDEGPRTYSNQEIIADKVKPDPSTLVEIENSLLTLFNMKRPPKIDRSKIVIPEPMRQLYEQITGQDLDSVNIPKPGLLTKSANTVRSFAHQSSKIDDRFPHHHRFRLYFDVNSIPAREKLKAAELQLTRDAISRDVLHPRVAKRTRYQVVIYDIAALGVKGKYEPHYLLLDNKTIRLNSTERISLDVKPAIDRWMATPKKNFGLLVEVRTSESFKPAPHHHVRLRRSADEKHEQWQHKQPILYTYTDDEHHKLRSIRDVSSRSKQAGGHHRRTHRRKNNEEICRRHSLYVDFEDVGWSDWIVAPPGYDAFYCHGRCPFPIAEHLNSTNHAVVQTLVNSINPGKVPKACCVPTQLEGISMLYLNDQSTVVLKNYQDMTVVGCGCR